MTKVVLSVRREAGKSVDERAQRMVEILDELKGSLKDQFQLVGGPVKGSPRALIECDEGVKQAIKAKYPELSVETAQGAGNITPPFPELKK